jgi:hypothetical protein
MHVGGDALGVHLEIESYASGALLCCFGVVMAQLFLRVHLCVNGVSALVRIPFNVIFLDQSLAVAFWQCVQCRDPEGIFTVEESGQEWHCFMGRPLTMLQAGGKSFYVGMP